MLFPGAKPKKNIRQFVTLEMTVLSYFQPDIRQTEVLFFFSKILAWKYSAVWLLKQEEPQPFSWQPRMHESKSNK